MRQDGKQTIARQMPFQMMRLDARCLRRLTRQRAWRRETLESLSADKYANDCGDRLEVDRSY